MSFFGDNVLKADILRVVDKKESFVNDKLKDRMFGYAYDKEELVVKYNNEYKFFGNYVKKSGDTMTGSLFIDTSGVIGSPLEVKGDTASIFRSGITVEANAHFNDQIFAPNMSNCILACGGANTTLGSIVLLEDDGQGRNIKLLKLPQPPEWAQSGVLVLTAPNRSLVTWGKISYEDIGGVLPEEALPQHYHDAAEIYGVLDVSTIPLLPTSKITGLQSALDNLQTSVSNKINRGGDTVSGDYTWQFGNHTFTGILHLTRNGGQQIGFGGNSYLSSTSSEFIISPQTGAVVGIGGSGIRAHTDIYPNVNNTRNLGRSNLRWNELFVNYLSLLGGSNEYIRGDGNYERFPTSMSPSGTAGGDLSGNYPNPRIRGITRVGHINSNSELDNIDLWGMGASTQETRFYQIDNISIDNIGNNCYGHVVWTLRRDGGTSRHWNQTAYINHKNGNTLGIAEIWTRGGVNNTSRVAWRRVLTNDSSASLTTVTADSFVRRNGGSSQFLRANGDAGGISAGDVPNLNTSKLTEGTLGVARGGTGVTNARDLLQWGVNDFTSNRMPNSGISGVMRQNEWLRMVWFQISIVTNAQLSNASIIARLSRNYPPVDIAATLMVGTSNAINNGIQIDTQGHIYFRGSTLASPTFLVINAFWFY